MFGIAAFRFMHASLSFLESSAILTDLSFLIVMTAGEIKQFSVVSSAFSRSPDLINFSKSSRKFFRKCMGTGRPFCCMCLASFFNWMSIVRSVMVWLFLNKSSCSLMIFFRLSSSSTWRITFVFLLPYNPISSLSSQSNPNNGCVFLFSVIMIGSVSLLFSVFTSTIASPLNLMGFLFTSTKVFVVFYIYFVVIIGGTIVTGEPVSMINSIGWPSTNRFVL